MVTREDVESYLLRTGLDHQEISEGMWLVGGPEGAGIVVHYSPPLVVFRKNHSKPWVALPLDAFLEVQKKVRST